MLQSTASHAPRRAARRLRASAAIELTREASTVARPQREQIATPVGTPSWPKYEDSVKRTVFANSSEFIPSIVHAFAALRAVEQKYGRVTDFRFPRDYEVQEYYQLRFAVKFHDVESVEMVPKLGDSFLLKSPECNHERPGGISLHELQPYLLPGQKSEDVVSLQADEYSDREMSSIRPISFNLTVPPKELVIRSGMYPPKLRSKPADVSRSFIKWGGFYELKKMEARAIPDAELFGKTSIDHVRMRRALQRHAQALGIRDPYEIYPKREVTALEWESIPELEEPSSAVQDSFDAIHANIPTSPQTSSFEKLSRARTEAIRTDTSVSSQIFLPEKPSRTKTDASSPQISQSKKSSRAATDIKTAASASSYITQSEKLPHADTEVIKAGTSSPQTTQSEKRLRVNNGAIETRPSASASTKWRADANIKVHEVKVSTSPPDLRLGENSPAKSEVSPMVIHAAPRTKQSKQREDTDVGTTSPKIMQHIESKSTVAVSRTSQQVEQPIKQAVKKTEPHSHLKQHQDKFTFEQARLQAQLAAAERATDRLAGKKKKAKKPAPVQEQHRSSDVHFNPSFRMTRKVEEKIVKEAVDEAVKREGITSKISSFFKLGKW